MPALACLDGEFLPPGEARVPITDRGFLFGDAAYEVIRVHGGRCWDEDAHLDRLGRSLAALRIEGVDRERLRARMRETLVRSGLVEAKVYIQVTRGAAPRTHAFPRPPARPLELIVVEPYDDGPAAAAREAGVAVISRPDLRWKRCDIKSVNLLANVLAAEDARAAGAFEAVLVDEDGFVTEATHSSVLWVRDGALEGSPDGPEILPGTTRRLIARLAADAGICIQEARVDLAALRAADEVVLAGTTIEVVPVVRIDEATVGDGRPGPVARRLQAAYREAVARWSEGSSPR